MIGAGGTRIDIFLLNKYAANPAQHKVSSESGSRYSAADDQNRLRRRGLILRYVIGGDNGTTSRLSGRDVNDRFEACGLPSFLFESPGPFPVFLS